MSRLVVGPFNRVEGDLEVRLDIRAGTVKSAEVVSPLYRGFEEMLRGKDPRDALVIAPRICGICSVSQSVAAAAALAEAQGLAPAPNGRLAANLVHAAENIADHLTHFYMFFMPDFTRPIYAGREWFGDISARFAAMRGTAVQDVLPARAQFLHLVGLMAGKWPHTMAIQPGGMTRVVTASEIRHLRAILAAFRRFLETHVFGDSPESFAALASRGDLEAWAGAPGGGDLRRFLVVSRDLGLAHLGPACARFMSFGAYPGAQGHFFARGLWEEGGAGCLNTGLISEDITSAWLEGEGARHPFEGETKPDGEMRAGYTWCKAPRLEGRIVEVGALARQVVAGHPLARDLLAGGHENGGRGNVEARIVARFIEIARLVPAMEQWLSEIRPREPFIAHGAAGESGEGAGLTEAARGALGHWLRVEGGRIANYQIIAPTTWNFSPRDEAGQPGPLETALEGAPVQEGEEAPVSVQHIVRSFDPCMVCTVH